MAKDWTKAGDRDEAWAWNIEKFKDPITGKVVPQTPEGEPRPASDDKSGKLK